MLGLSSGRARTRLLEPTRPSPRRSPLTRRSAPPARYSSATGLVPATNSGEQRLQRPRTGAQPGPRPSSRGPPDVRTWTPWTPSSAPQTWRSVLQLTMVRTIARRQGHHCDHIDSQGELSDRAVKLTAGERTAEKLVRACERTATIRSRLANVARRSPACGRHPPPGGPNAAPHPDGNPRTSPAGARADDGSPVAGHQARPPKRRSARRRS
jgi:hypothetical protein